jgi:succinoglycan biosynthesis protein ExoL
MTTATPRPLQVLQLAFDLSDAAVHKRTRMLLNGGADVRLAGFRRVATPVDAIHGCPTIDFGQTYNGQFMQRLLAIMRIIVGLRRYRSLFTAADVIIARNLEMLAIGVCGRVWFNPSAGLVYECLDIHRLLLKPGFVGMAWRRLEGFLMRRAQALFTSSPSFVGNYFHVYATARLPVRLIENKVLATTDFPPPNAMQQPHPSAPPWRIGWFGIIRCRQSLAILVDLVKANPGKIEVVIRGRPALDQIPDFHAQVAAAPGITFQGSYQNPADLAVMYGNVHFTWAIDMFEAGQNSAWLLPNRLYEGGIFGTIPITIAADASGKFIQDLGIGVALPNPLDAALREFFSALTPAHYQQLAQAAATIPTHIWVDTPTDCRKLIEYLVTLQQQKNIIFKESLHADDANSAQPICENLGDHSLPQRRSAS